jgi:hypothetical protein
MSSSPHYDAPSQSRSIDHIDHDTSYGSYANWGQQATGWKRAAESKAALGEE